MDEIEKSRILSDMTRTTETSNSTNSMLTYDPNSFQSQVIPNQKDLNFSLIIR